MNFRFRPLGQHLHHIRMYVTFKMYVLTNTKKSICISLNTYIHMYVCTFFFSIKNLTQMHDHLKSIINEGTFMEHFRYERK